MTRRERTQHVARLTLSALGAALLPGCDFDLGAPRALWLTWLVLALVALQVHAHRSAARQVARFADLDAARRLGFGAFDARALAKGVLVAVALLAAIVALTEPRYGFTWRETRRRGVDIVLAVDVSDSMLAEDASAGGALSRLERTRRKIVDLLQILQGDRVGIVAFAGDAHLVCPLTLDYAMAATYADDLGPDVVSRKGTDVAAALRAATRALRQSPGAAKAIVLITDGEDHGGEVEQATAEAKEAGIRVDVLGVGRPDGAPIPEPGGGFRRDRQGEMVVSRLEEPALQAIALTTGGRYVRSVTGDLDLEALYTDGIRASLAAEEHESTRRKRWHERFQWALAASLVALVLEGLLPSQRRRRAEVERAR